MSYLLSNLNMLKVEYSYKNIYSVITGNGTRAACEYLEDGNIKTISYTQYDQMIKAAAQRLHKRLDGQGMGSYIGIKLANSPNWPIVFWAVMMAGYNALLLDYRAGEHPTVHSLAQARAIAIFSESEFEYSGVLKLNPIEILGGQCDESWQPLWNTDACVAMCTSGTTADAKIFAYDGNAMSNQIINAEAVIRAGGVDIISEGTIKLLAFLPMHHIFGFVAVYLWYSFFGKTMVYLKDRSTQTILDTCRRHGVTHMLNVPMFWNSVAKAIVRNAEKQNKLKAFNRMLDFSLKLQKVFPKAGAKIVSRYMFKGVQKNLVGRDVKFFISGGGHILPETMRIINGIGYPLYNGFGMTETGVTSVELDRNIKFRLSAALGRPFSALSYKIENEGLDGAGDLLIKGQSMYSHRLKNGLSIPFEGDSQGYFHTGDIGRIIDGRLWIEGRSKEVIINASGENVYPDELEDYFVSLQNVEQYSIMGIYSPATQYEDIALVLYLGDYQLDKQYITGLAAEVARINRSLPPNKMVKRVIISTNPLPLANGIKVQRQKVKARIENNTLKYNEVDLKAKAIMSGGASADSPEAAFVSQEASPSPGIDAAEFTTVKDEVRRVFAEILNSTPSKIGDFDHFIMDLGGDSLDSLGVFTKLEEKYNVMIPDAEYMGCTNVNDLSILIMSKLKGINISGSFKDEQKDASPEISDFKLSREWKELSARVDAHASTGSPYFIEHDSPLRDSSIVNGKEIINLASYNYLCMSGHPRQTIAAKEALDKYGASASGSRLLAGEKPLYRELEAELADWKHTEDSVVMVGGHSTNVSFVGNFCNQNDLILYDIFSHNSIVQGCQLSRSETKAFPHNDFKTLEFILKANRRKYEKVLIVVEGVYSMDGDIAPIPEFIRIKKEYNCFLMVDEAHSTCVIGETGNGVDEYFSLNPTDIDIKMGTLSKGLGACGGYIAASRELCEWIRYSVPGFVFSVGISPPLAAAALAAIRLIREDNSMVTKLHGNIKLFIEQCHEHDLNTCLAKETAIVPVMIGGDHECFMLSQKLLENGVSVPPATYPAVPKGQSRLRFCLTSDHKPEQLIYAVKTLKSLMLDMNLAESKPETSENNMVKV